MTLNKCHNSLPDRLVCDRVRLAAQGSIRNDDMRNTPVAALVLLRNVPSQQWLV